MKKIARSSLADLVSLCATGYNQPAAPSNVAGKTSAFGAVYMFSRLATISSLDIYVILRNVAAAP